MRNLQGATPDKSHPVFAEWYGPGRTGSGHGSSPHYTARYRAFLQSALAQLGVKSVLDWGCGDWQFSRLVDWSGVEYVGTEVVAPLVDALTGRYARDGVRFLLVDPDRPEEAFAASPPPEPFDLVICKDVLQHLPIGTGKRLLDLFDRIGRRVLLINDLSPRPELNNLEMHVGGYRPIDPAAWPFRRAGKYVFEFHEAREGKKAFLYTPRPEQRRAARVFDALAGYWMHRASPEARDWSFAAMRAVLSYDEWLVPLAWLDRLFPERAPHAMAIAGPAEGNHAPAGRLWAFASEEEVRTAGSAGWAVGACGGPVAGLDLFGALCAEVEEITVNPGAAWERTWLLAGATLASARQWVDALGLERALASGAPGVEARLAGYPSFVVLLGAEGGAPTTIRAGDPPGDYVPAFTAPDRARAFAATVGARARAVDIRGAELFRLTSAAPVAGVALNPDGATSILIPSAVCSALAP